MTFKYAACSCGWREDADGDAAALLAEHRVECEHPMRPLLTPMWSMVWPPYWGVRGGEVAADDFGLEMAWRTPGSNSTVHRETVLGVDPKAWHLFPANAASTDAVGGGLAA